jgi:hypothetical protein
MMVQCHNILSVAVLPLLEVMTRCICGVGSMLETEGFSEPFGIAEDLNQQLESQ